MDVKHKSTNTYPERVKATKRVSMDGKSCNDLAYYNKDAEALQKASDIEWAEFMGVPVQYKSLFKFEGNAVNAATTGICAIDVLTGPGVCNNATDPVNNAFFEMMVDLYARTAASELKIDQSTMAVFMSSGASISNLIAFAKKIFRSVNFWINRNVNYPRALIQSCGFDFDEISKNIGNYFTRLNVLINRFNTFSILKSFDVYQRQYSLFENVYIDEDSDLAQIYHFKPINYYKYTDLTDTGEYFEAPWTVPKVNKDTYEPVTFGTLLDIIDECISSWRTSQVFYYVTGTINRAYPDGERWIISNVTMDEVINPVVEDTIMAQVMNATIVRGIYSEEYESEEARADFINSVTIHGNPVTGIISWGPKTRVTEVSGEYTSYILADQRLLRAFKDTPSNDDNVEMSRFVVYGELLDATTNPKIGYPHASPELIVGMGLYTFDIHSGDIFNRPGEYRTAAIYANVLVFNRLMINDDELQYPWAYTYLGNIKYSRNTSMFHVLVNDYISMTHLECFRYVPLIIMLFGSDGQAGTTGGNPLTISPMSFLMSQYVGTDTRIYGDLYNYTFYSRNQYVNLQRVCLLSLYKPTFVK